MALSPHESPHASDHKAFVLDGSGQEDVDIHSRTRPDDGYVESLFHSPLRVATHRESCSGTPQRARIAPPKPWHRCRDGDLGSMQKQRVWHPGLLGNARPEQGKWKRRVQHHVTPVLASPPGDPRCGPSCRCQSPVVARNPRVGASLRMKRCGYVHVPRNVPQQVADIPLDTAWRRWIIVADDENTHHRQANGNRRAAERVEHASLSVRVGDSGPSWIRRRLSLSVQR